MPSPTRSARERRRLFFTVAFFAICSFAIWPARHVFDLYFSDEPDLDTIPFYGVVAAGGALTAIWSVLGSEPFWIRTRRSALGCVLLSGCWVLGFFALMSYSPGHSVEFIDWFCWQLHLPLLFVTLQIPLWALRCVFRKGLVWPNGQWQATSLSPLTIGDALSQTVLVGCAFASLHIAYWLWGYNSLDYASELIYTSLFCLFVSCVLIVPTVIAVLRPRRNGFAAVASIACLVLPQVALFPLTPALYPGMYNPFTHQNVLLVKLTVFVFTASLTGTLVMARWSECRLGRVLQATVNTSQLPEQRTRHWQFGLGGVVVGATLVAICLGTIIGPEMRRRAYQAKWAERGIRLNTNAKTDNEVTHFTMMRRGELLPPEIWGLTNLTYLNIDCAPLDSLPEDIGNLEKLTHFSLPHSNITTLPPEIGKLTELSVLEVFSDKLTSLPPEIGKLTKLMQLSVGSPQLDSLPHQLANLSELESLALYTINLSSLPPNLGNLKNLRNLYLDEHNLAIEDVRRLKQTLPLCAVHARQNRDQLISERSGD